MKSLFKPAWMTLASGVLAFAALPAGVAVAQEGADDDPDADALTNLQEFDLGTFPTTADTDGDGANDGSEASAATDPLNASSF